MNSMNYTTYDINGLVSDLELAVARLQARDSVPVGTLLEGLEELTPYVCQLKRDPEVIRDRVLLESNGKVLVLSAYGSSSSKRKYKPHRVVLKVSCSVEFKAIVPFSVFKKLLGVFLKQGLETIRILSATDNELGFCVGLSGRYSFVTLPGEQFPDTSYSEVKNLADSLKNLSLALKRLT